MEKRKLDSRNRYFYALSIAIALFVFGFSISYGLNSFEFERVSNLQEDIFYDFYKTKISYNLFDLEDCNELYFEELGVALDFQGAMLEKFENEFGKENKHVAKRKKFYSLLQLSHYDFMQEVDELCGFENDFVLFFYSNDESHVDQSERIGDLLRVLKSKHPSVLIYSFDSNSNDPLIEKLKLKYEIKEPVTILFNGVNRLNYIDNISQLENYL